MGYSIDLRKRVLQFVEKGSSVIEAAKFFSVNRQSVYNWIKKKKDTGSLKDTIQGRPWRKLNAEALAAFVDSNPDLTLGEYAQKFETILLHYARHSKDCELLEKKDITLSRTRRAKKGAISGRDTSLSRR